MIPLPPTKPSPLPLSSPLHSTPQTPKPVTKRRGKQGKGAYLQILVRSLLVLLIHGPRGSLRSHTYRDEQREADRDAERRVPGDLPAFAWRGQGAGPVGAEGDIVCYFPLTLARSSLGFSLPVPIPEMSRGGGELAWSLGGANWTWEVMRSMEIGGRLRTSFLLLYRQLAPVHFHPVPERHP